MLGSRVRQVNVCAGITTFGLPRVKWGKEVEIAHSAVSQDGKTLTVTIKGVKPNGPLRGLSAVGPTVARRECGSQAENFDTFYDSLVSCCVML
jgi:hypothetical protein